MGGAFCGFGRASMFKADFFGNSTLLVGVFSVKEP